MKTNRFFTKLLAVMMTLALCSGMVLPALAATIEATLECPSTEHVHDENCYEVTTVQPLVCEMTEEGHTHGDECYAWTYALDPDCGCGSAEHTHTVEKGCFEETQLLTCGQDEHSHDDSCNSEVLSCGQGEHSHGSDCYDEDGALTCEETEHEHGNGCYTEERTCGQEAHAHVDSCYTSSKKLTCTESDLPTEKHTEDCYTRERGELLCTLEEVPAHEHTDDCYGEAVEQETLICELEAHTHTADCYTNKAKVNGENTDQTLEEALKKILEDSKDEEVTLVLNGQILEYKYEHDYTNSNNAEKGNAIVVKDGNTLNIEDAIGGGGIHGNGDSIRLIKVTGGTVNLKGGTISGGTGTGGGAIFVSGKDSELNMSGGSISGNNAIKGSNGGAVFVQDNAEFNMSGGSIDNNTVIDGGNGGGVYVGENGTFNMTGGTISNNTTDTTHYDDKNAPMGQGGGVAVGAGGKFNMSGGTIDHNTAGEGGGVFVDRGPIDGKGPYVSGSFTMNGGTIDSNTAKLGEGGGVYIKGEGEITKGNITNNVTNTYEDLGGGGIYIEAEGVLTLKNAIITSNTANGMGGGIAACVHGKTYVYALEGALITGNTALGQGHTQGHLSNGSYNGEFIDGYTYWASAKDILKEMGQDIFAAGDGFHASFSKPDIAQNSQGTAGIVVSNNLPMDSGLANWEGYTYCYVTGEDGKPAVDSNGNYIFEVTEVTETNNGVVYGNRLVFLTANPDQESVQKAIQAMQGGVIISGNLSANSHGGGIANNGVLTIGKGDDTITGNDSYVPEVDLEKNLKSDDEKVTLANKEFTFKMEDEAGNLVGTVTNDANGNATFNFPEGFFDQYLNDHPFGEGDEQELVFYVTEDNDHQENVTYDGTIYKVVITLTRTTEEVKLGDGTVTLETVSIGEPKILVKIVHEDGTDEYKEAENGIVFNNTYKTPDDDDDDEPNGNEDPTPTPTPTPELPEEPVEPDEPVEDLPEPEVPLDELPDESLDELPEPEVPLNDVPYEEEEILDEEVPLADVPQTGDISLLWYVGSLLSTCGLAALAMGKKRS